MSDVTTGPQEGDTAQTGDGKPIRYVDGKWVFINPEATIEPTEETVVSDEAAQMAAMVSGDGTGAVAQLSEPTEAPVNNMVSVGGVNITHTDAEDDPSHYHPTDSVVVNEARNLYSHEDAVLFKSQRDETYGMYVEMQRKYQEVCVKLYELTNSKSVDTMVGVDSMGLPSPFN